MTGTGCRNDNKQSQLSLSASCTLLMHTLCSQPVIRTLINSLVIGWFFTMFEIIFQFFSFFFVDFGESWAVVTHDCQGMIIFPASLASLVILLWKIDLSTTASSTLQNKTNALLVQFISNHIFTSLFICNDNENENENYAILQC